MRGATKKLIVNKKPNEPGGDFPIGSNSLNSPFLSLNSNLPIPSLPFPPIFSDFNPPNQVNFKNLPKPPEQILFPCSDFNKKQRLNPDLDVICEKKEQLEFSCDPSKLQKKLLPSPFLPLGENDKKKPFNNPPPPKFNPLPAPISVIPESLLVNNTPNLFPRPTQVSGSGPSHPYGLPPPNFASNIASHPSGFPTPLWNDVPPPLNPPPPSSIIPTNIFEITFDDLRKQQELSTGDPLRCSNCKSFFSLISQPGSFWKCEFCETVQPHDLDLEETPNHNKILYILKSLSQSSLKDFKNQSQTIIFCIDISGSMCVTIPVAKSIQIKTNKLKKMREELMSIVGAEWMQVANSPLSYISRLDCVQAAIENQLESLSVTSPDSKVGLITFNDEVCIIGDGSSVHTISGDYLNSSEAIYNILQSKHQSFLSVPIKSSKLILQEKVLNLNESGSTALGPALLSSILLASQSGSGSKVIVCTDGVANTGLGDIENQNSSNFYTTLADLATEKGVEVSVISISDQECRLDALIPIVEKTGGDLSKVNPATLSEDFANILSTQIYATHTKLTVRLSDGLEFKDGTKILYKDIGNVNDDTIFTFEFLVNEKLIKKSVPIQVEIQYKDMQGNLFVLVHTENFEVAENQEEVIKEANFEIISKNAQFQGANLIKQGRLREADENLSSWNVFMNSNQSSREQSFEYQNLVQRTSSIQHKIQTTLTMSPSSVPGSSTYEPPGYGPFPASGMPSSMPPMLSMPHNAYSMQTAPVIQPNNFFLPSMPSYNTNQANFPQPPLLNHSIPNLNHPNFLRLPIIPYNSPPVSDDLLSDAMKLMKNQKK